LGRGISSPNLITFKTIINNNNDDDDDELKEKILIDCTRTFIVLAVVFYFYSPATLSDHMVKTFIFASFPSLYIHKIQIFPLRSAVPAVLRYDEDYDIFEVTIKFKFLTPSRYHIIV